jgi:hypothetical protein
MAQQPGLEQKVVAYVFALRCAMRRATGEYEVFSLISPRSRYPWLPKKEIVGLNVREWSWRYETENGTRSTGFGVLGALGSEVLGYWVLGSVTKTREKKDSSKLAKKDRERQAS